MRNFRYTFLGLDLGQRNDFSAVAMIDYIEDVSAQRNPVTFEFYRTTQLYLRGLTRFPRGTSYVDIPGLVRDIAAVPPPGHLGPRLESALAVDAGGPGIPVVELLRRTKMRAGIMPAIITGGGMGSLLPGGMYSVARRELVGLLHLALESRLLVFPADMPLKEELIEELSAIEPEGGQYKHDDMAIAIALALWASTRRFPGLLRGKLAA